MDIMNATEAILSNKGYIRINGIDLAELNSIEVKITPEKKTIGIMNSATKGEIITSYTGTIDFELHKVFSRFTPALLKCAKELKQFKFELECTTYNPTGDNEETLTIGNCWMNGEVILAQLKADADFVNNKFSAGFQIESASFDDELDDGESWDSL